jgi:hypothetical protein
MASPMTPPPIARATNRQRAGLTRDAHRTEREFRAIAHEHFYITPDAARREIILPAHRANLRAASGVM